MTSQTHLEFQNFPAFPKKKTKNKHLISCRPDIFVPGTKTHIVKFTVCVCVVCALNTGDYFHIAKFTYV